MKESWVITLNIINFSYLLIKAATLGQIDAGKKASPLLSVVEHTLNVQAMPQGKARKLSNRHLKMGENSVISVLDSSFAQNLTCECKPTVLNTSVPG